MGRWKLKISRKLRLLDLYIFHGNNLKNQTWNFRSPEFHPNLSNRNVSGVFLFQAKYKYLEKSSRWSFLTKETFFKNTARIST